MGGDFRSGRAGACGDSICAGDGAACGGGGPGKREDGAGEAPGSGDCNRCADAESRGGNPEADWRSAWSGSDGGVTDRVQTSDGDVEERRDVRSDRIATG